MDLLPELEIMGGSRNSQSCNANFAPVDKPKSSTRANIKSHFNCLQDEWIPYLKINF